MKKILVLTAGFGEGHNAAARNLVAAFTAEGHAAKSVDVFALASPRLNDLTRRAYLALINRTPRLWKLFYTFVDRAPSAPGRWLLIRETRLLARLIESEQPDAICSTFPVYCHMLEQLRKKRRTTVPYFSIVTDSISINSVWWRADCDGWFVPNDDTVTVFREAGIDTAKLHVSGFPVPAFFSEHAQELQITRPDVGHPPRVLYIINSGTNNAETTVRLLLAQTDWEITCAVGRNEPLRQRLQELASGRKLPANILGWTDQMPRLLMTHHAVITKAGGATTQEAIAARCPMIVNQIVPGQEEGNYELLRRHGIGALAETPDAAIAALRRAFESNADVWSQWRQALEPLARPDAAKEIATQVLVRIENFTAAVS